MQRPYRGPTIVIMLIIVFLTISHNNEFFKGNFPIRNVWEMVISGMFAIPKSHEQGLGRKEFLAYFRFKIEISCDISIGFLNRW